MAATVLQIPSFLSLLLDNGHYLLSLFKNALFFGNTNTAVMNVKYWTNMYVK